MYLYSTAEEVGRGCAVTMVTHKVVKLVSMSSRGSAHVHGRAVCGLQSSIQNVLSRFTCCGKVSMHANTVQYERIRLHISVVRKQKYILKVLYSTWQH